jgi:hypothetical protein
MVMKADKLVAERHEHMPQSSLESQIRRLEDKLDLALMYLRSLDGPGMAESYDVTPPGWGITLADLIRHLESNIPLPETSRFHRNPDL